jgi:recombination protein RecT
MTTVDTTALARIEQSASAPANFGSFLEVIKPRLDTVLPTHIKAETIIRVVQTFGAQNEKLLKCTESSLLTSMMLCSQLGLPPNTPQGFAWLIPFKNHKQGVMECKVMFGKNGLAQLVRNSGEIARMNSGVVYRHEVESGLFAITDEPPDITHRPNILARKEDYADKHLVAAYALVILKNGDRVQRMLRLDQIEKRRDNSQAVQQAKRYNGRTPWDDWFPEMARKTAIRALCGAAEVPKSTDLVEALQHDVDSPAFDELQQVAVTRADGFRTQASAGAIDTTATPAALPPPPAADSAPPPTPPPPAEEHKKKQASTKPPKPRKATKAQTGRLWGRWAKITDCDPKAPAEVDKESFRGFVAHRIGEEKAKDSTLWTTEDCKVIGAALDDIRDGKTAPPAAPSPAEPEPTAESEQQQDETESAAETSESAAETSEPAAQSMSQADALAGLKALRKHIDMPWDQVRELAVGLGITAKQSAKWDAAQCIEIMEAMKSTAAADEENPPPGE